MKNSKKNPLILETKEVVKFKKVSRPDSPDTFADPTQTTILTIPKMSK